MEGGGGGGGGGRRAGPSLLSAVFLQPLQLDDVGTPVSIGPQSETGAPDLLECPHSCPQGVLGHAGRGSEEAQGKKPALTSKSFEGGGIETGLCRRSIPSCPRLLSQDSSPLSQVDLAGRKKQTQGECGGSARLAGQKVRPAPNSPARAPCTAGAGLGWCCFLGGVGWVPWLPCLWCEVFL